MPIHPGNFAVNYSIPRACLQSHLDEWQCAQRQRLQECSGAMREALTSFNLIGSTSLFCTLAVPNVATAQVLLAEHKIWTRCFRQQGLLRLGLVQPHELERLRLTLDKLNKPV